MNVAIGSRQASAVSFVLTAAVLSLAAIVGGGQGTLGDTAVQLLSVALLAWLVVRAGTADAVPQPLWTWWPVLAIGAIALLQNLPIPDSLWRTLGGRAELAEQLAIAEVQPQARWSLHPLGSERALFWLLPAVAIYLSVLRLPRHLHRHLISILLALAALGVLLGLAQLAGGTDSPLRVYANTNRSAAVGFFANRNHFAVLLASCLPLALAWTARTATERPDDRGLAMLRIAAGVGLCLLLILGLAVARSRAGLVLAMIAVALSWPMLTRHVVSRAAERRRRSGAPDSGGRTWRRAAVTMMTLVVIAMLSGALRQAGEDSIDGDRRIYAGTTLHAAQVYAPLGSGLGTFRPAYQPFERDIAGGSGRAVVNHAHNDYLEAWLEAGWLALPAAALVLGTLIFAATRTGRDEARRTGGETLQRRAVAIAVLMPVLHSLVDYPLRTSAHLAVFGLLAGLLVAAAVFERKAVGRDAQPAAIVAAPAS